MSWMMRQEKDKIFKKRWLIKWFLKDVRFLLILSSNLCTWIPRERDQWFFLTRWCPRGGAVWFISALTRVSLLRLRLYVIAWKQPLWKSSASSWMWTSRVGLGGWDLPLRLIFLRYKICVDGIGLFGVWGSQPADVSFVTFLILQRIVGNWNPPVLSPPPPCSVTGRLCWLVYCAKQLV